MSSTMISNYREHSDRSRDSRPKKRQKIYNTTSTSTTQQRQSNDNQIRWKTSTEQQIYSSKLIDALRQVRRHHAPPISGSSVVRSAADKVLAMAARGRSHWSRSILASRLKLCRKNHRKIKIRSKIPSVPQLLTGFSTEKTTPVEKRVKVLGLLVPGCRKLSLPNLLEETSDYIAALQMQVRAMTALAVILSGSSFAGSLDIEPAGRRGSYGDDNDNPVH